MMTAAAPSIESRMVEFLGGSSASDATAVCIQGFPAAPDGEGRERPPSELSACLEQGLEVRRSLWDRRSLVADLDIEYINFDRPGVTFCSPERAFELQQPVVQSVRRVLARFGIAPLELISGRGHHFLWRVERDTRAFHHLADFGRVQPALARRYRQMPRLFGEQIEPDLAAAFSALGMVMEYVVQQVKADALPFCEVPIEVTEVLAGPGASGREIISLDISEYADPLDTRMIRVPFSRYLKPQQQPYLLDEEELEALPPMFVIPRAGMELGEAIATMRDAEKTAALAATTPAGIPEVSAAAERLIAAYEGSDLAAFHTRFYRLEPDRQAAWPKSWEQLEKGGGLQQLPRCVETILTCPNDLLLKLSGIRRLVRVLLAEDWHPRHIAGLIHSRYESDQGWGDRWQVYDPGTRADFYTRVFAGLVATGQDHLVDFNCRSAQEERFCFHDECPFNLADYRDSLLHTVQRRLEHGRLVRRPVNRLFLPDEHL